MSKPFYLAVSRPDCDPLKLNFHEIALFNVKVLVEVVDLSYVDLAPLFYDTFLYQVAIPRKFFVLEELRASHDVFCYLDFFLLLPYRSNEAKDASEEPRGFFRRFVWLVPRLSFARRAKDTCEVRIPIDQNWRLFELMSVVVRVVSVAHRDLDLL